MRVIQPSIANRITFATLARKAGFRNHSSVSYYVPDDYEVPARLMAGAQVDGKPYEAPTAKPKRTRKVKAQVETETQVEAEPEQESAEQTEPEHSEPQQWQPRSQQTDPTEKE